MKVANCFRRSGHDLWDLYEWWLPSLDSKRLKSIDLLDQILVVYTIKRALNGDSKAIDALFRAYERAAIGIACKMVKKEARPIPRRYKTRCMVFLETHYMWIHPGGIFNSLMETEKILPFPKWIESFISGTILSMFRSHDKPLGENREARTDAPNL